MKTKFAIGCLVQWYEIEILPTYIDTLLSAVDVYDREQVLIDIKLITNQELEQVDNSDRLLTILHDFYLQTNKLVGYQTNVDITDKLVTIADARFARDPTGTGPAADSPAGGNGTSGRGLAATGQTADPAR